MAQLNRVMVIGNLTRDPELRYAPNGAAVADIGLAVNRSWRTEAGEEKEEVCFINAVLWGKRAEAAAKHVKKGSPVFIEGHLKYETWTDKTQEKRSALKLAIDQLQFLPDGKPREQEAE